MCNVSVLLVGGFPVTINREKIPQEIFEAAGENVNKSVYFG